MWTRNMLSPATRGLALVLSAAVLSGCGSDDDPAGPGPGPGESSSISTVNVDDAAAALIGGAQHTIGTLGLGQEMTAPFFYIYTPAGYDASSADGYPVLALLHGFGDDMNYWTDGVDVKTLFDELIAAGTMDPMIVVMPNGVGGVIGSWYADSPVFGGYATYIESIIGQVEASYNSNGQRAIAGLSMGGFGAFHLAMGGGQLGLEYDAVISHSGPINLGGLLNPDPYYGDRNFPQLLLYEASTAAGLGLMQGSLATGCTNVLGSDAGLSAAILELIGDSVNAGFTTFTFGAAAAFSPHYGTPLDFDMLADFDGNPCNNTTYPIAPANADSSEWVGVNFPIQADGQLNTAVWEGVWMGAVDPMGRLGGLAAGTKVYVDCGNQDELGLSDDTATFADAAGAALGTDFTYETFDGGHEDMIGARLAVSMAWLSDLL